jgi:hypothetical protein
MPLRSNAWDPAKLIVPGSRSVARTAWNDLNRPVKEIFDDLWIGFDSSMIANRKIRLSLNAAEPLGNSLEKMDPVLSSSTVASCESLAGNKGEIHHEAVITAIIDSVYGLETSTNSVSWCKCD